MSRPRKLSGAALAAKLGELSFPAARSSSPLSSAADPSGDTGPDNAVPLPRLASVDAHPPVPETKPRGGRPAKAGVDGMPVNVRLAQADHLALAKVAGELIVPGRPMPTVQDVVRGLIRGALKDVEALKRLVREGA